MSAAALAAMAAAALIATCWAVYSGLAAAGEIRRQENARAIRNRGADQKGEAKKKAGRANGSAKRLAAAGISAAPGAWAGTLCALAVLAGAVGLAFGGAIAALAFAIAAPLIAELWMRSRAKSRAAMFDEQLARALPMIAQSVGGAGVSFDRALAAAAENAEEPLKTPLSDCVAMARLDGNVVTALEGMAEATGSKDLDLVVAAARTNRESGGDLAKSLSTIAKTIDMRLDMRRTIGTATASAMSTMKILVAIPLLALPASLVFFDASRDFYATPEGWGVLAAAALFVVAAIAINKKIADMDED